MANEDRLPQFDRAKIKTPIGFFSTLFRLMRISEEFAIPAIVKEYDRNTGIVKVQPLVSNLADDVNNKEVEIPRSEYEVHVVRFAHGGYVVDAPLFVGDTGWLIAGDRNSTSAIKANSTILKEDQTDENSPNEGYKKPDDNSLKSFAWGFFIPDTWGITDFTEEDGLVVRGQRISVESDHVTVECGENSASISKESVNIDTEKCSIEIKEDYASVISGKYGAKIDGNGAIVEGPNDKISIDDNGLHHEGVIDEKRDIISGIKYDEEIGDIIKKSFSVSKRGDLIVDIDEETDWERLGLPNLPSVNDGKLTIRQGNDTLGEFTANQESNTTVIIPEPVIPVFDIIITQATIAPSTDHPGGGIRITFQPTQDGVPVGQPTVVDLWNDSGGGGGTDLSDTPALDVVTSTGQSSAGVAATASRSDHIHKMPNTVVLTDVDQTINSVKTIRPKDGYTYARLDFQHTAGGARVILQHSASSGQEAFQMSLSGLGNLGNIIFLLGTYLELGARTTGTGAFDDVRLGLGASNALANIAPKTSGTGYRRIADVRWVTNYFQQKLTAGSNITISGNTISATQPTVNDGTLTIKQGTTTLGMFTANQATDSPVTVTIPEPQDGTLTIKQGNTILGTFTANQDTDEPVTIQIPEPPTPPSLSDTPALEVVPSTGQASAGVSAAAARYDHVHKMPETVVLTDVAQTINSVKKITPARGASVARLDFQYDEQDGGLLRVMYTSSGGEQHAQIYLGNEGLSLGNIIRALGTSLTLGAMTTGTGAIDNVSLGSGADAALDNVAPSTTSLRVVDVKWVTSRFQQKLTAGSNITISGNTISATQPTVNDGTLTIKQGTTTLGTFSANQATGTTVTIPEPQTPSGMVEFIPGDGIRWNPDTHTLQKRVDTLNMATGAVTQGEWSDITNGDTTPISSILTQSS